MMKPIPCKRCGDPIYSSTRKTCPSCWFNVKPKDPFAQKRLSYGRCPRCRMMQVMRKNGRLGKHKLGNPRRYPCKGVGLEPVKT